MHVRPLCVFAACALLPAGLPAKPIASQVVVPIAKVPVASNPNPTLPATPAVATPTVPGVPATTLGMNAGIPTYYSGEWAFADVIKNHSDLTFAGQMTLPIALDPGGRPVSVPAGTTLFLPVDFALGWQEGTYNCRVSPGWSVSARFPGPGGTVTGSGTDFTLTIPPRSPGYSVQLVLLATANGARLDLLSCTPPNQVTSAVPGGVGLTQAFSGDMQPFGVIRFMDWMKINNGAPTTWATRPLPTDISIVPRGAAVEDMVAVANQLGSDPWFTLPLDADDDYQRQFATYVRDHLAPTRKAYVELSNEVWNQSFQQGKDAVSRGHALYPGTTDQQASDYYYGDRVRGMMAIWSSVFAGQSARLVRVASTQLFWTQRGDDMLGHNDTYKSVDALAGAPYFGSDVQQMTGSGSTRIDAYFAALPQQITNAVAVGVSMKAVADKYKIGFITYEGGPESVGYTADAAADANAIVHDPRMHDLYLSFLQQWQAKVGGLLALYDSAGTGTFAHKDYSAQPVAAAPKMRAITDFAATLPPAHVQ